MTCEGRTGYIYPLKNRNDGNAEIQCSGRLRPASAPFTYDVITTRRDKKNV